MKLHLPNVDSLYFLTSQAIRNRLGNWTSIDIIESLLLPNNWRKMRRQCRSEPVNYYIQTVKSVENRFCKMSATNFVGRKTTDLIWDLIYTMLLAECWQKLIYSSLSTKCDGRLMIEIKQTLTYLLHSLTQIGSKNSAKFDRFCSFSDANLMSRYNSRLICWQNTPAKHELNADTVDANLLASSEWICCINPLAYYGQFVYWDKLMLREITIRSRGRGRRKLQPLIFQKVKVQQC